VYSVTSVAEKARFESQFTLVINLKGQNPTWTTSSLPRRGIKTAPIMAVMDQTIGVSQ
jgi:hypothetical protein